MWHYSNQVEGTLHLLRWCVTTSCPPSPAPLPEQHMHRLLSQLMFVLHRTHDMVHVRVPHVPVGSSTAPTTCSTPSHLHQSSTAHTSFDSLIVPTCTAPVPHPLYRSTCSLMSHITHARQGHTKVQFTQVDALQLSRATTQLTEPNQNQNP